MATRAIGAAVYGGAAPCGGPTAWGPQPTPAPAQAPHKDHRVLCVYYHYSLACRAGLAPGAGRWPRLGAPALAAHPMLLNAYHTCQGLGALPA